jgi:hypothetical protein
MDLRTTRETTSCVATREFTSILWNLKVHYRIHKSPRLISIMSQINPVHTTLYISAKSISLNKPTRNKIIIALN